MAIQKKQAALNKQLNDPIQRYPETEVASLSKSQQAAVRSLKHQGRDLADITIAEINAQVDKFN
ncbi:MAG: hypothetical protein ACI95C_000337 [Pseudohongiellaceae bacterium]